MRVLVAALITLAGCAGGSAPVVMVDTQLGDWTAVQAWADRDCARAGLRRAQFTGYRDRVIAAGSGDDVQSGDQRYAEFLCRTN